MARTHENVRYTPESKVLPERAGQDVASAVESSGAALRILEGRWKLVIILHLLDRPVLRFSELERAIPGVTQKMLAQQLRQLERDGIVRRTVYPQVPPKVEYALTAWGNALCPAVAALMNWAALRGLDAVDASATAVSTDRARARTPQRVIPRK